MGGAGLFTRLGELFLSFQKLICTPRFQDKPLRRSGCLNVVLIRRFGKSETELHPGVGDLRRKFWLSCQRSIDEVVGNHHREISNEILYGRRLRGIPSDHPDTVFQCQDKRRITVLEFHFSDVFLRDGRDVFVTPLAKSPIEDVAKGPARDGDVAGV